MSFKKRGLSIILGSLAGIVFLCGCEDSGGGDDVGDNNPDLVVCLGDSITAGYRCDGAPYPTQLAAMSGKTVRNMGVPGARTSAGVSKITSALACKPGYVCILYGANDAIKEGGSSANSVKESLRAMITACKENKSIPIIATTPPMIRGHSIFDGGARTINEAIRSLADEEGVRLVDLYPAFEGGEVYIGDDGLHPNAAGAALIAQKFNDEL